MTTKIEVIESYHTELLNEKIAKFKKTHCDVKVLGFHTNLTERKEHVIKTIVLEGDPLKWKCGKNGYEPIEY